VQTCAKCNFVCLSFMGIEKTDYNPKSCGGGCVGNEQVLNTQHADIVTVIQHSREELAHICRTTEVSAGPAQIQQP
jgi:hypothetical protein